MERVLQGCARPICKRNWLRPRRLEARDKSIREVDALHTALVCV
jgi:hypothetical protein